MCVCCVYLCTFWIEELWVNWSGGEADGGRDAGTEKWDQSPAPITQERIEEVTPELWQLLSKLAYLKRLAAFYLAAFPRFFQFVCFWNPEWVSTAGEGRKTTRSSVAKYEVHEDLEYENENNFQSRFFPAAIEGILLLLLLKERVGRVRRKEVQSRRLAKMKMPPQKPLQLQRGSEIPDFAAFPINSSYFADALDKTCSFCLCAFQCWSSKALITQRSIKCNILIFLTAKQAEVVCWIYEASFPTALCFYRHHRHSGVWWCVLWLGRSLWGPCQHPVLSAALTWARTDAPSESINHLFLGNYTSSFLPLLPLQKINLDWMSVSLSTKECSVFSELCF